MIDPGNLITAAEARQITKTSSPYTLELERAMNRVYRHIRAAAEQGLSMVEIRPGGLVDEKDVFAELKKYNFKVKTVGEQSWATW